VEHYGLDVHKRYTVFTCVDDTGAIVRRGRVTNHPEELSAIVKPSGGNADLVLEATGNWSHIYDAVDPWVAQAVLAHPLRVKAIASAKVKTDRIDADTLAQLLRADLIPTAYAPPREIRDQRDWLRSRAAVVGMATQLKNRIHALLAKDGFDSPKTDLFGVAGRKWLRELHLPGRHQEILERYLRLLEELEADIQATTAAIQREAKANPAARLLMTIPGIGPLTALLFLAEVGDVHRFESARQVVSYAGLAPRVRASGGHVHLGPITKQGSPWLRWIFTQAAVSATHHPGALQCFYNRIKNRHGSQTAATALARKLLTLAYSVSKNGHPYRESGVASDSPGPN
jgi:transposase